MTDVVVIEGDPFSRLAVEVPDGWRSGEVAGADAVLWDPRCSSAFRTNVVLSCDSVDGSCDLAGVATHARLHLQAGYDSVDVRGERSVHLGDAPAIVRLALFDMGARAIRLAQLQVLADGGIQSRGENRIVFQIVATCRLDDMRMYGDLFTQIVASANVRIAKPVSPLTGNACVVQGEPEGKAPALPSAGFAPLGWANPHQRARR